MLRDQDLWLNALAARNNVSHAYNPDVALDIIHQTKESFYGMFIDLRDEIDRNWRLY